MPIFKPCSLTRMFSQLVTRKTATNQCNNFICKTMYSKEILKVDFFGDFSVTFIKNWNENGESVTRNPENLKTITKHMFFFCFFLSHKI